MFNLAVKIEKIYLIVKLVFLLCHE